MCNVNINTEEILEVCSKNAVIISKIIIKFLLAVMQTFHDCHELFNP